MVNDLNEWPTSSICDELELDFATRPSKGGRRPPKGGKYFYRARIPVDWVGLAQSAINVRYRTADAAPVELVLSLSVSVSGANSWPPFISL